MKTNIQLLSFVFLLLTACNSTNKNISDNKKTEQKEKAAGDREYANWQDYNSQEYDFSSKLPSGWESSKFSVGENLPVFNFYASNKSNAFDFPITVHANAGASFVAVYPKGYGVELPMGKSRNMNGNSNFMSVPVNNDESKVFMLENDQEWGYFIVPSSPPAGWSEHGFIFAQIATEDFGAKCFDKESGEELEMSECDPMMGDIIKRTGKISQEEEEVVHKILQSFKFENKIANDTENESSKGIRVEQPVAGAEVSSLLKIKGEARGNWYFEAEFTVALMQNGKELSVAIVKADGEWMTNDFVPFLATMELPEKTENGKAFLVFKNSNPSGKRELDKTFRVPVLVKK